MQTYLDGLLAQTPVYYGLVDLMSYGKDAIDLGAFVGSMSVIMSRLAGPKGQIVAVEASRKNAKECQRQLNANGASNVFLINRAVWSRSDEEVNFQEHSQWPQGGHITSPGADIPPRPQLSNSGIRTVCVDDIVTDFNLCPWLIKADLEGGEYQMLQGATNTIETYRPIFILEQRPDQVNIADLLLKKFHYCGFCLENYDPIINPTTFYETAFSHNAAFIPQEKLTLTAYCDPNKQMHGLFNLQERDRLAVSERFAISPGRYVLRAIEGDRPALLDKPIRRSYSVRLNNADGSIIHSARANGRAFARGMPIAIVADEIAQIEVESPENESLGDSLGISSLILERVVSIPALYSRYNDLALSRSATSG